MLSARTVRQITRLMFPAGAAALCLTVFFARPAATTVRAAPAAPADGAPANPPSTKPVAALAQERIEAATEGFRLTMRGFREGSQSFGELGTWSRRQAEAALDPAVPAGQRVGLLEQHVKEAREMERIAAQRHQAGLGTQDEAIGAKYHRLEAEIWRARAREGGQPNRPAPPGGQ